MRYILSRDKNVFVDEYIASCELAIGQTLKYKLSKLKNHSIDV